MYIDDTKNIEAVVASLITKIKKLRIDFFTEEVGAPVTSFDVGRYADMAFEYSMDEETRGNVNDFSLAELWCMDKFAAEIAKGLVEIV